MVFLSAGHNAISKNIKQDPGAVGVNGLKEGILTIEFRDLVKKELDLLGVKYITDSDEESLAMYLERIKTGNASVVIEYHFDAASNPQAGGSTSLVEAEADRLDKLFATEIVNSVSSTLGIRNRGVISEADSHRGRLGLMREEGIICLCELAFITNADDIAKYNAKKKELAKIHAQIILKYENLIS